MSSDDNSEWQLQLIKKTLLAIKSKLNIQLFESPKTLFPLNISYSKKDNEHRRDFSEQKLVSKPMYILVLCYIAKRNKKYTRAVNHKRIRNFLWHRSQEHHQGLKAFLCLCGSLCACLIERKKCMGKNEITNVCFGCHEVNTAIGQQKHQNKIMSCLQGLDWEQVAGQLANGKTHAVAGMTPVSGGPQPWEPLLPWWILGDLHEHMVMGIGPEASSRHFWNCQWLNLLWCQSADLGPSPIQLSGADVPVSWGGLPEPPSTTECSIHPIGMATIGQEH